MTGAPAPVSRSAEPEPLPPFSAGWGEIHFAIDDRSLTVLARRLIGSIADVDDLTVRSAPGELSVTIVVRRFGVPLSARARLSQIRFKDGFLAFVLDSVDALSFIPIPDALLGYLIDKAPPGLLTYYKADRILVVNLSEWMPTGLDLTLDRVEFGSGEVRLFFPPGRFDMRRILSDPKVGGGDALRARGRPA